MPLIRSAVSTVAEVRASASLENPALPLTSAALVDWLGGPKTHAGVDVTEKSAMGITAVWRAVNLLGGGAAALPLHAYDAADDGRKRSAPGTPAARLLATPHPDLTPFEFWELVYCHLLLWGNAYVRILRNRIGEIQELWPLHPGRVRAGRESDTGRKVYEVDASGEPFYDDKILHIPGLGYDGICGVSPIRLARQGIGLALAAEEYGARLFGSGSLASGILQTEQRLEQGQADALKTRWKAKMTGLGSAHDVAILDAGAKFQQLSIPPEDAQFIESRKFQIDEIARMFGIPPHMLGQVEKSTSWGTGIEQQSIGFVVFTMKTWLVRVEQRVTRLVGPRSFAKYSVEGLLRGDSKQRADFYKAMWDIGVFSTNDIREMEDRPGVGAPGDVRYRPLNMGVLGQSDAPAIEGV